MKPFLFATGISMLCFTSLAALSAAEPNREQPLKLTPAIRERCVKTLQAAVKSDEFWPAMHAAEALTLAGREADVVAALKDRLPKETDELRRCGLARELVRAGDRQQVTILFKILEDEKSPGRIHAAESLYKVGEVGDGKSLRAAFAETANPPLMLMAAAALAKSGDKDALARLREQLKSPLAANRNLAAFALARVGGEPDIEPLLKTLDTEQDPSVRAFVASALACLGNTRGREELGRNLDATDAGVRAVSAEFAGHSRSVEYEQKLMALLDDSAIDTRVRAAQALLVLSLPADNGRAATLKN